MITVLILNRFEIEGKRPKWKVLEQQAYHLDAKTGEHELSPETPVEHWYNLMATIHRENGHLARDKLYKVIKANTNSISKAFCGQYAATCCTVGEMNVGGIAKQQLPRHLREAQVISSLLLILSLGTNSIKPPPLASESVQSQDIDLPLRPNSSSTYSNLVDLHFPSHYQRVTNNV
jgi:hypothetical protein